MTTTQLLAPRQFRRAGLLTVLVATLFASACSTSSSTEEAGSGAVAAVTAPVEQAQTDQTVSEQADATPATDSAGASGAAAETSTAGAARLNLNSASDEELMTVPGAGERMVREFKEYRPYVSITQFRRELAKYVDDDVIAGFELHLFVPISVDESDAETLMQIPGVDAATAEHLIASRPYGSNEAFLTDLGEHLNLTAAELAVARQFLAEP